MSAPLLCSPSYWTLLRTITAIGRRKGLLAQYCMLSGYNFQLHPPGSSRISRGLGKKLLPASETWTTKCWKSTSHPENSQSNPANPQKNIWPSEALSDRLPYIPRRTVMYVPADDQRKVDKIPSLNVDCPVLECEDGVASSRKNEARQNILRTLDNASWVTERKRQQRDVAVRINSIQSGLAQEDLQIVLSARNWPTTLLVPKIDDKEHVQWIADQLENSSCAKPNNDSPLRVILYVESSTSLLSMKKIFKTALKLADGSQERFVIDGAVFGSDDFCADIGATRTKEATEVTFARQNFVAVLKSFARQLQAIDLVHIDYKDLSDLKRQSEEGARWGFTGKQIIHPTQAQTVQAAFSPSAEKLQWAQELVDAFTQHQQQGKGAFTFRNSMIDKPLLLQAQNILQLQRRLSSMESS